MNFNKIFGYFLLFLGLVIICWSLYGTYNIFTDKTNPPEIFELSEEKIDISPSSGSLQNREDQIRELIKQQLEGMIPPDSISKLLNLISWSIMIGIFVFAASKISSIGIQLIRK